MSAASNLAGNRNSTPEASNTLRPPSSRQGLRGDTAMRASADMASFSSHNIPSRSIRPASEVYYGQAAANQNQSADDLDKATQQWLADIDQYEATLEEMATATLDQDFKDELSAIEQWFKVLSEAERTAALYALLQQTTQIQLRFFIQVLQEMAQSHPMSGILSPSNFAPKDPMSQKLSDAMNKLSIEGSRHSLGVLGRIPASPVASKRLSALDPAMISSMFPDAANAIAKQKEQFTQTTGMAPPSTRNSIIGDRSSLIGADRTSLIAQTFSAPQEEQRKEPTSNPSAAWSSRPKSSQSQKPTAIGHFSQPVPASAGLKSPMNHHTDMNLQSTEPMGMPLLSPYAGSWASMAPTPMTANFNMTQSNAHAEMVANATAMKLAAMSTVNNRIQLDDVKKFRRQQKSVDHNGMPQSPGLPLNFINEHGQMLTPQQVAALQAQQLAVIQSQNHRSRPNSPGVMVSGAPNMGYSLHTPQNSQFLTPFDTNTVMNQGISVGQYGVAIGGDYGSDAGDSHQRGRSPRGKRGSSKPPEDPTDMSLLNDIPAWLRSQRLHKYTDHLKDLKWQDLVEMDEDALEKRGVAAQGARRKLLKVFEQVREAMAEGKLQL